MELAAILEWNSTMEASYTQLGARVVNTYRMLTTVVDEILAGVDGV